MPKPTIEQVKTMSKNADTFVTADGQHLRMQFRDEDSFTCLNEETYEEFEISYDTVTFVGYEAFLELTKVELPS